MVLQIPLGVESITILVLKDCNIPIPHPQVGNVFQDDIESNYLAVTCNNDYVMIPQSDDVTACYMTKGHY